MLSRSHPQRRWASRPNQQISQYVGRKRGRGRRDIPYVHGGDDDNARPLGNGLIRRARGEPAAAGLPPGADRAARATQIVRHTDGTYLLYTILPSVFETTLHYSKSLSGPWTSASVVLNGSNPAPYVMANSSIIIAYKTLVPESRSAPEHGGLSNAVAADWRGPFTTSRRAAGREAHPAERRWETLAVQRGDAAAGGERGGERCLWENIYGHRRGAELDANDF